MPHLRQSTVGTIIVGPALSNDTGTLALTNLTIVPADVMLSKEGGAFAAKNHAGTAAHGTRGQYHVVIDATDTNTLGRLYYDVSKGTALPMWGEYEVMEATKYDGIYGTNSIPTGTAENVLSIPAITSGTVGLAIQVNTGTVARAISVDNPTGGTVGLAIQVNGGTVGRANSVPDPTAGTIGLAAAVTNLTFSGSAVDCNLMKVNTQATNDGQTWGSFWMDDRAMMLGTIHRNSNVYTVLNEAGGTAMVITSGTDIKTVA